MKSIFILFIAFFLALNAYSQSWWGSSGNPNNGITINWSGAGSYDSIQWGFSPIMEKGRYAANQRSGFSGYFYSYSFPGSINDSIIYYKIYNSSIGTFDSVQTFKIPTNTDSSCFTFDILGDSRSNYSTWGQVAALANQYKTDFSIHLGDIVDDGTNLTSWTQWFSYGAGFLNKNLTYYCVGNHEANDTTLFQNIFTLPDSQNTELYYSFEYGNAVFICLNTEYITNQQTQWLYSTLHNYQNKKWKIVFFHRPFYSIGYHVGEMDAYLDTWWKAFDSAGVDLIFSGHEHLYERTKPINYSVNPNTPVNEYGSNYGQGRCEIICGGAGAPLYAGTPDVYTQAYASVNHFCKISVCGNILIDSTFSINGSLIDSFIFDKTNSAVESKLLENELKIYPNPVYESIYIQINNSYLGKANIEVFQSDGKKIKSVNIDKKNNILNTQIDLPGIPEGLYILKVFINGKELQKTFVVK